MTDVQDRLVIAVDGGGSRCRMVLRGAGVDLRLDLGPANASSDFEGAVNSCCAGLADLAKQAGQDLRPLPAYFGLAGISDAAMAARFAARLPLDHVRVEEDRAAAVTGALGPEDGAVIHAGTGSFVALQRNGALTCVGGWGPKLGDEGSAHWVGREILRTGLGLAESLVPDSALGRAMLERFAGPSGIISFATRATAKEIAALAPLLLDHAEDPQTRAILSAAGQYFSKTLQSLGWHNQTICPTGGLAPHLTGFLPPEMRSQVRPAQADPIEGALLLARRFAREIAP